MDKSTSMFKALANRLSAAKKMPKRAAYKEMKLRPPAGKTSLNQVNAMNGKRLNNFGGKNPQRQSSMVSEPTMPRLQPTVRGKQLNNFGGKNPQTQRTYRIK